VRDFEDDTGWVEFDRLYRPLLVRFARARGLGRTDAEEISQQCLEIIVKQIGTFRRRKSFRGWLRRMVNNKVKQFYAQKRRHAGADPTALIASSHAGGSSRVEAGTPHAEENPAEMWEAQWDRTHMMYCLANLRETFAPHTLRAFELYVLHEWPVDRICRLLGMSANQVYVAKRRVLKGIQARYARLLESLYGV
jgi:RNA polymerase sigma factor (sigma-70 family)